MTALHDYIKVIPNALDPNFCDSIIHNQEYRYVQAPVLNYEAEEYEDAGYRNCEASGLFREDDAVVFGAIGKVVNEYMSGFRFVIDSKQIDDTGYNLLKYKAGGFYRQHIDDHKAITRRVSMSLLLNDDYDGGDFQFFGDYKVNCGAGSAIVFPSNYCFPHEILDVTGGERYSIVTWVY